ncbi:MAG TPA: glycosyltransferase family 39 protein, partial [Tepidisphaeraceae bacterium]|nr:glycosyltransferase family 39 protein [Tepidisphaeraceae bacterium]
MRFGRKWVLLALLAGAMFLLLLGRREFASSHEARVGQVARQMAAAGWPWESGRLEVQRVHLARPDGVLRLAPDPQAAPMHVNAWVVPILSGQVRLQKPPLPYWCAAVAYKLSGVSEATSRLAPALLGALATLLLYSLGAMLYGRRVALIAVLIWLTTYLVPEQYRLAMADPYLAFFTLAAVWAWV